MIGCWVYCEFSFSSPPLPSFLCLIKIPKQTQAQTNCFLPSSGCPIGELWNLEELAKVCAEQKQYSFFLTSAPLNVPGGVASPPNAVAVF